MAFEMDPWSSCDTEKVFCFFPEMVMGAGGTHAGIKTFPKRILTGLDSAKSPKYEEQL